MRKLIQLELNKGVTQRELARKMKFSHGTLQKILFTETNCTYEIRKKVADYFHVPVSDFYESGDPPGQDHPMKAADLAAPKKEASDNDRIALLLRLIDKQDQIINGLADQVKALQDGREMLIKEFRAEHRETREEIKICWAEVNKKQDAISQMRGDLSELNLQVSKHIHDTGQEFSDIKAKMDEAATHNDVKLLKVAGGSG